MSTLSEIVIGDAAEYLQNTYVPRLERALAVLPEGDLWWRPHEGVITVGTILLHLAGNVRQWIVCGIGGAPDHRDRSAEFAAMDGPSGEVLLANLAATVAEACTVIQGMDTAALERTYSIQGADVTGLYAVSHVVEHFSWHTGQAVWIAKGRAGVAHGVTFYDDAKVNRARNA
ncbi:MAG: DUF1572 domain-containing protein [bacterium]|nr:DUF1572 domain-containing protein [bacterium]